MPAQSGFGKGVENNYELNPVNPGNGFLLMIYREHGGVQIAVPLGAVQDMAITPIQ